MADYNVAEGDCFSIGKREGEVLGFGSIAEPKYQSLENGPIITRLSRFENWKNFQKKFI